MCFLAFVLLTSRVSIKPVQANFRTHTSRQRVCEEQQRSMRHLFAQRSCCWNHNTPVVVRLRNALDDQRELFHTIAHHVA